MLFRAGVILAMAASLGSCRDLRDDGEIDIGVIGSAPRFADPQRGPLDPSDALIASATATGLVAIDANGQVEPGLAETWIVTEDGLSTIFRIRQAQWPDGSDVTGDDVARSLNRMIAADSRNPLKPLLTAVDSFVGMTGRVVEVRLKVPRPNLLQLLAQPEAGIRRAGRGTGPYSIASVSKRVVRLRPVLRDDAPTGEPPDAVVLRFDRPALAIARFEAGQSELVTGGTLADWPYVRAARLRTGLVRFDGAQGLFGLEVISKGPFLATSSVRNALSMAIDRNAIATALDIDGWTTSNTVLPTRLDSIEAPHAPDWAGSTLAQRRADAVERVAGWRSGGRVPPVLRVALPSGPGMRIVFARIAADWRQIGVRAVAVPIGTADADLRLVDALAPNVSANWYLTRLSCAAGLVCDAKGDRALLASRSAPTLAARSALIAEADVDLAARASFIPLGAPVRWMIVDPRLSGWRENALGIHPFDQLRPGRATGG